MTRPWLVIFHTKWWVVTGQHSVGGMGTTPGLQKIDQGVGWQELFKGWVVFIGWVIPGVPEGWVILLKWNQGKENEKYRYYL